MVLPRRSCVHPCLAFLGIEGGGYLDADGKPVLMLSPPKHRRSSPILPFDELRDCEDSAICVVFLPVSLFPSSSMVKAHESAVTLEPCYRREALVVSSLRVQHVHIQQNGFRFNG